MVGREAEADREQAKPVPILGPEQGRLLFFLRQIMDLQMATVVAHLRQRLPTLSGRVLDIGCGMSPWKAYLRESATYQGVDIEAAEQFGMVRRGDVAYFDGVTLPFGSAEFDAAICIEVLEHCPDPQTLLGEAFRVLRPGAPLALSVPWSARVHHAPFDYFRFTSFQLRRMLKAAGFVEIDIIERGNDVCAVANKLIVMGWRLLMPERKIDLLWSIPLAVPELCLAALLLLSAHASLRLGLGSRSDPLGYFAWCRKPGMPAARERPAPTREAA